MAKSMITTTERALAPVRATQGRRSLFSLFAGVGAAALAPPAVAAGETMANPVSESPELLALGKRLDDLMASHGAAVAREAGAAEDLARHMPPLPPELIASPTEPHQWTESVLRANSCGAVMRDDGSPLRVYTAGLLQVWIDKDPDISRHTVRSRRVRKLIRIAKSYEADVAEAERLSEISERRDAVFEVRSAMQAALDEVIAIEPQTMVGVGIYARAALAADAVLRAPWPREASYGEELGTGLAAALLRLQKEAMHG